MEQLSKDIIKFYEILVGKVDFINKDKFFLKAYQMSGVRVSAAEIISYQIGWGKLLIYWYESGAAGIDFIMPGEGFDKWNYKALAKHFFSKYSNYSKKELMDEFHKTVSKIVEIVNQEGVSGNLEQSSAWEWLRLKSGKKWPLSKWVTVNTVAPYKRAIKLIL